MLLRPQLGRQARSDREEITNATKTEADLAQ